MEVIGVLCLIKEIASNEIDQVLIKVIDVNIAPDSLVSELGPIITISGSEKVS